MAIAYPLRRLAAVGLLAALAVAVGALVAGCEVRPVGPPVETTGGDAPLPAASGEPSGADDTADSGSAPASPAFAPIYHGPAVTQGSCSGPQLLAYYGSCFGSNLNLAACAEWADANPGCNACLVGASSPADVYWGPIVVYPTTFVLNQAGCIARTLVAETRCAEAIEDAQECEYAVAAPAGRCAGYEQSLAATCAGVQSVCFVTPDVEASFLAISSVFCQ